jgi:O-antigen ligase
VLFDDLALIALPVGLSLYLGADRTRSWPYLAGAICCLGGLLATQSRLSIMFGLAVSVMILFYAFRSSRRSVDQSLHRLVRARLKLLFGSCLATVALALLLQPDLLSGVIDRFQSLLASPFDRFSTASFRLHLWQRAITAFLDHPVFGVGPGGYGRLFDIYQSMHLSFYYHITHYLGAHNVLSSIWPKGLIGGLGLVAFVANTVRLARRCALDAPPPVALALLAWALALTLTVLIEGNWMWGQLSFVMALFSALIARQIADRESPRSPAAQ